MSGTLPEYDKIVRWTINDVNQWLSMNSFAEFGRSFREAGVDGAKFVNLEQLNFNQMRSPMNKRGKLLEIIRSIKRPAERVSNKVTEIHAPKPSPAPPTKDYGGRQNFQSEWNNDGSASGSEDDYEWNDEDFDSDDQDGGHDDTRKSRANFSKAGQSGYQNQQVDDGSDSQDDYENIAENGAPMPPVPNRGRKTRDPPGTIMDKLKDALNQRGNSLPRNQAPVSQNSSEDEGSNSDYENPVEEPKTPPRRKAEPAQPPVPSRPGRNHHAPKKQVYDEPEKEVKSPPVPPSNRRGHPGGRPQLAVPGRQKTPPRPSPGKSRGRREPPPPEPEETYEVPEDLAPAPPDDEQAVYEDPDEPTPPARPPAKSMNLPPRPTKSSKPDPRQDTNRPQVPPPRTKNNRRQQPMPPPSDEGAGYMSMNTAPQPPAGDEPEDDYLGPDDLNPTVSEPPQKEKKMFRSPPPEETKSPPREVSHPPRGNKGSRPLPPKPSPAPPEPEDPLEAFDWYHGSLNREEGEKRLKQHKTDGMFLIRKSKGGGDRPYTLMIFNDSSVFNLPIRLRSDDRFAMGKEKKNEQTFYDLEEMVEFFNKRTIILAASSGGQTRLKHPLPS